MLFLFQWQFQAVPGQIHHTITLIQDTHTAPWTVKSLVIMQLTLHTLPTTLAMFTPTMHTVVDPRTPVHQTVLGGLSLSLQPLALQHLLEAPFHLPQCMLLIRIYQWL